MKKRIAVTGTGAWSPLGNTNAAAMAAFRSLRNCVSVQSEVLGSYQNFNTSLGAVVSESLPPYPRKKTRTMGRVGTLAAAATEDALRSGGFLESPDLRNGRTGVAYGTSGGSFAAMEDVSRFIAGKDMINLHGSTYPLLMPHSVAVNLSIFFGVTGSVIATSVACASGSQALCYGRDAILLGREDAMLCGGAEEYSPFFVGVFDALFQTSQGTDPSRSPRPFDRSRDGIVAGEGAGTLLIEDWDHAIARGARPLAEIVGAASNSDAVHITSPDSAGMERCMRMALDDAGLPPSAIGYVNGHGTGTELGDIAESQATYSVFGHGVPFSAFKCYMGHTLGAAGALETIYSILMQREGWFAPNLNLTEPDSRCGDLDYITGSGREIDAEYIMVNNFAFGGVNTSLVIRKAG